MCNATLPTHLGTASFIKTVPSVCILLINTIYPSEFTGNHKKNKKPIQANIKEFTSKKWKELTLFKTNSRVFKVILFIVRKTRKQAKPKTALGLTIEAL